MGLRKLVLGGIGGLLGYKNNQKREDNITIFKEFPWERYLIKEDIIKKWRKVDMNEVAHLLRNYDIEKSQFTGVDLEKVSVVRLDSAGAGEMDQWWWTFTAMSKFSLRQVCNI